jgi:hypothetical protein
VLPASGMAFPYWAVAVDATEDVTCINKLSSH